MGAVKEANCIDVFATDVVDCRCFSSTFVILVSVFVILGGVFMVLGDFFVLCSAAIDRSVGSATWSCAPKGTELGKVLCGLLRRCPDNRSVRSKNNIYLSEKSYRFLFRSQKNLPFDPF